MGLGAPSMQTAAMAVMRPEAPPALHADRRRPGLALLVAVLAAVPYALCLALPYYVNGIHQRPAGETVYAYDLSMLWPYDTVLGGAVGFVAVVGVPTAPFVSAGVAVYSVFAAWAWRRTLRLREVALYAGAAAVGVATIGWLFTPLANTLLMWFWD
jgi:hypothetical protein